MADIGFTPFAAALLDPHRALPPGLAGAAGRRFAVYRNNVTVGLVKALETRFPAVAGLVGAAFFRALALDFARRHPPASPLLMDFGDGMPDFIAAHPAAAELTYLADIARIEVARTRAYHAADLPRLGPEAFAAVPPEKLGAVRIRLHPAVFILRSTHPAATILAMARGDAAPAPIADWTAEAVLIDRPGLDALVRPLPPGTAAVLAGLAAGATLGAAAATALDEVPGLDLPAALAELIGSRLAAAIHLSPGEVS